MLNLIDTSIIPDPRDPQPGDVYLNDDTLIDLFKYDGEKPAEFWERLKENNMMRHKLGHAGLGSFSLNKRPPSRAVVSDIYDGAEYRAQVALIRGTEIEAPHPPKVRVYVDGALNPFRPDEFVLWVVSAGLHPVGRVRQ